jgi:cyanuric acid amidohydrolase
MNAQILFESGLMYGTFTRGYFTQSLMALLAERTGETAARRAARSPCVLSGGTEGALSPHAMPFAVGPGDGARGLALGTAFSAPAPADAMGTDAQIAAVADTLRAAMREAASRQRPMSASCR